MQLKWTEEAAADLEHIVDYLFEHAPEEAPDIIRSIYKYACVTSDLGRQGRKQGTRELVLPSLPYVVIYAAAGDIVYVVRILHGAQKWPLIRDRQSVSVGSSICLDASSSG